MTIAELRRTAKALVKAHLPRGANVGPAVVQLFLNDERETRVALMNFPAFLAPQKAQRYSYRIWVYDEEGEKVAETRVSLPLFGATDLKLREVFGARLPRSGMVAARIAPESALALGDRHLGRIKSHFFTLYAAPGMSSVGLVHPQTSLDSPSAPERFWASNIQLCAKRLRMLEVFQVNPSAEAVASEVYVRSKDGETLASVRHVLPPRGTRGVAFDVDALKYDGLLSVALRGLAAANGKPILFAHFHDNSFTCCHA